jgi:hypothetical protein
MPDIHATKLIPEPRRRLIQAIWRRAPLLPLPLRMKNLRRAEQLAMLWRAIGQRDAEAAGIGDEDGA